MLDHALKLASTLRFALFPVHTVNTQAVCSCGAKSCRNAGKHPLTWHGFYDATTNAGVITTWWRRWPKANIAIRTGAASNIVVVDVDAHKGGLRSIEKWFNTNGTLQTLTARTGRGGLHYYLKLPRAVELPSRLGIARGIDIKAERGYVVAPPSRHSCGDVYKWIDTRSIQPTPNWLVKLIVSRTKTGTTVFPLQNPIVPTSEQAMLILDELFASAKDRIRDGRNAAGFWLACQLRDHGFTYGETESILVRFCENVPQATHRYTFAEARHSARQAFGRPPRAPYLFNKRNHGVHALDDDRSRRESTS